MKDHNLSRPDRAKTCPSEKLNLSNHDHTNDEEHLRPGNWMNALDWFAHICSVHPNESTYPHGMLRVHGKASTRSAHMTVDQNICKKHNVECTPNSNGRTR